MKILKKISQSRRDFTAILICEHCKHEQELKTGYDDSYYHENVIPKIKCKKCDKIASDDYQPQKTVYPEGKII